MLRSRNPTGGSPGFIARRRDIVADYMSRGIESYTLINEAWIKAGILNPDTNEPYSEQTLSGDKRFVKEQWAKANNEKIDLLVGDLTSKCRKVFQLAMDRGDYAAALNALKAVREMLDVDRPRGSRALKAAADERKKNGEEGLTDAQSQQKALELNQTPAVLGEMLQILMNSGAISAALMPDTEESRFAKDMHAQGLDDLIPASSNNVNGNDKSNGRH